MKLPKGLHLTANHCPVTKLTPPVTTARDLRGPVAPIASVLYSMRNFPTPAVYKCEYFNLRFYPPEHPLGAARKSKPSVFILFNKENPGNTLNSNFNKSILKESVKTKKHSNSENEHPTKYAIWRSTLKQRLKHIFWSTFLKYQLNAPDGVYQFHTGYVPIKQDTESYHKHMDNALKSIINTTTFKTYEMDKFISSTNKCASLSTISRFLEIASLPGIDWDSSKRSYQLSTIYDNYQNQNNNDDVSNFSLSDILKKNNDVSFQKEYFLKTPINNYYKKHIKSTISAKSTFSNSSIRSNRGSNQSTNLKRNPTSKFIQNSKSSNYKSKTPKISSKYDKAVEPKI